MAERGVVAAGHPLTAEAGAGILRAGGNAVDAALAALMMSFMTEPLLTGLGAGGYMLVSPPGGQPVLLDFMVEVGAHVGRARAAGRGGDRLRRRRPGVPHRRLLVRDLRRARGDRRGRRALRQRAAARARRARDRRRARRRRRQPPRRRCCGRCWRRSPMATPESRARYGLPREGERVRDPELADGIERLAAEGAAPFYTGDIGARRLRLGGRARRDADARGPRRLRGRSARDPIHVRYHGREVLTNPPPSAGGVLIAYALALLERGDGPPGAAALVDAMEAAQAERTDDVPRRPRRARLPGDVHGLAARLDDARLGAWTPTAGRAASRPPTARARGIVVPGTGIHVNNMLGEQDLSPAGWFTHPPGRRLPSMMAPTIVLEDGRPELVVGCAGSNRIRSRDPAGDRQRDRPRDGRPARGRRAAPALRGRPRLRRAGHRGHRRAARWSASASPTCSSAAARRPSATTARARSAAAATPAAAAPSSPSDGDHLAMYALCRRAHEQVAAGLGEAPAVLAAVLEPR